MKNRDTKSEKWSTSTLESLTKFCQILKSRLKDKTILLLNGSLGAGKTKTVEFLLKELGAKNISSPTFTLHQVYQTSRFEVDHFDLYRIQNDDDLESSGFWDVLSKSKGLVIVEWAEKLNLALLPKAWDLLEIRIHLSAQERETELLTHR